MTTSRKGSHQIVSFFPQTKQFWANEDFPPRAPAGIAKQGHGAGSNLHQLIALCPKGPGFQEQPLPSEEPRASNVSQRVAMGQSQSSLKACSPHTQPLPSVPATIYKVTSLPAVTSSQKVHGHKTDLPEPAVRSK